MKPKILLTTALIAGLGAFVVFLQMALQKERARGAALRAEVETAREAAATAEEALGRQADELERLRADRRELNRLRGEVTSLRSDAARADGLEDQVARLRAAQGEAEAPSTPLNPLTEEELEAERQINLARMEHMKQWGLALITYAVENEELLPANLESAQAFLPPDRNQAGLEMVPGDFELRLQGRLSDVENPSNTILACEREPWVDSQGRLTRAYVFADGHSELRVAPDGNFERIEQEIRDRSQ